MTEILKEYKGFKTGDSVVIVNTSNKNNGRKGLIVKIEKILSVWINIKFENGDEDSTCFPHCLQKSPRTINELKSQLIL